MDLTGLTPWIKLWKVKNNFFTDSAAGDFDANMSELIIFNEFQNAKILVQMI